MPGMQHVVYAKSSKVLAATSCCLHKTLNEVTLDYIVSSAFSQLNKNRARYARNVYALEYRNLPQSLLQPFIVYYLAPCLQLRTQGRCS